MDNFVEKKNLINKNTFHSYSNYSFVVIEKKKKSSLEKIKFHKLFIGNVSFNHALKND